MGRLDRLRTLRRKRERLGGKMSFDSFCQFMYQPSPCKCGSKDIDVYNVPMKVVIHCRDCEREVESKYLLSAVEEWDAGR